VLLTADIKCALSGIKHLRVKRSEPFVLSREQEARLLAVVSVADRALLICALDTLLRVSDILRLRREHDRGTYLVVEDSKVKPYKVPVSSRLRKALDQLPIHRPFYFAHRRSATRARDHRGNVQAMLERACQKAGIPYGRKRNGLTFHGLRHTGATRLAEAGVSMRTIQEIGG
jgi:integrase